jgi:hypothetical protein
MKAERFGGAKKVKAEVKAEAGRADVKEADLKTIVWEGEGFACEGEVFACAEVFGGGYDFGGVEPEEPKAKVFGGVYNLGGEEPEEPQAEVVGDIRKAKLEVAKSEKREALLGGPGLKGVKKAEVFGGVEKAKPEVPRPR